ncbi:hypothetical protein [Rhizomonospora bruguierae]|uniref:hypothetical protein n=1 Tax=Rhizomonospora bruguierae TaxID=1581705 RepID=UPI001BCA7ABD|nr:hypothetical protein [Micromonospora sp. NBRC 107566]
MGMFRRHTRAEMDPRTAERLLGGEPAGPEYAELQRLLATAAAPAEPGELSGEAAALAAFRAATAAHHAPAVPTAVRGGRRLLAVKLVAASTLLLTAGAAVATGGGHLPERLQDRAHGLFGAPAAPQTRPQSPARPSRTATTPPPPRTTSPPTTDPQHTPSGPPSTNLVESCRAWLAADADPARPRPKGRELAALVQAANGRPRVSDYCGRLLGVQPEPGGTGQTSHPTHTPAKGQGRGQGPKPKTSKGAAD